MKYNIVEIDSDNAGLAKDATLGEVQTTPTQHTLLGRVKELETLLASLIVELQGKADLDETQPISAASLPLPAGAATEAKLEAVRVLLASLEGKDFSTQTTLAALLIELQAKADLSETQPVSAASLPLPLGASTESKQTTGNSSLSNIDTSTASVDTKIGEVQVTPTSNTILGRLKDIWDRLLGQATAAKQDILLTELQLKADLTETQPVSSASLPLPAGAATSVKQDILLTELELKADLTETQPVSAIALPLPSGAATEAKQTTGNSSLSNIDASTASVDTKTGEVQATPTSNTILGRLKDIWDRLLSGITIRDFTTGDTVGVNTMGQMQTVLSGMVDENNSTVTLLGNTIGVDNVFTGVATEVLDYGFIFVTAYSDVASDTNGLSIEQSSDGVNWDSKDTYSIPAATAKLYAPQPAAKWFRVVYTNGASVQTVFRLQTVLKKTSALPSSHKLNDAVSGEDDAQLVKSAIAYRSVNDGTYNNVGIQNPLPVDGDSIYAKDIWLAASDKGNFSGAITDIFDNLHSIITDNTANDPKLIEIHFNRTIITNTLGIGAVSGNFSNVKVIGILSGNIEATLVDNSANSTKFTTQTYQLPITAGINAIRLEFYTADPITMSNLTILKTRSMVSRLQGVTPAGLVVDLNATNGGNFKVSLEEFENAISVNNNTQLKLTLFGETGIAAEVTAANAQKTDSSHVTQPVSLVSTPLPADASTETKQDSAIVVLSNLLTELQLKADLLETQPVSQASQPLPSGASTETKQDNNITALVNLLTELQLKADLSETQPVSAASLPLPTGSATSAKQDLLLTEMELKADLSETQPVSQASQPLPTGASTEVKQDNAITALANLLTELQLKADLTEIQPVETIDANVIKFDPDDSRPLYMGTNLVRTAATSASTWTILKYTYDGVTDQVTQIERLVDAVWDDRGSIF